MFYKYTVHSALHISNTLLYKYTVHLVLHQYTNMVRTGHCRNCGVPSLEILCLSCRKYRRCGRCYRHLPTHLYQSSDSNLCNACQNRDKNNVGRYCLDRVIGDRTWRGTADDIDVSNFIQERHNDITITFETARNENESIKYYFEMEVEFYRTGPEETDVQHTTARFYIPPMTSDVDELNLSDIITQFMEKIDGFSGQNSGWIISQIKYLRLCWGCYRPLTAGTYIPTPKSLLSKKAIVNVRCLDDNKCFQYSVLAGINVIKSGYHKYRPSQYKKYMHMLNMDGIESPVPLSSIGKFENQNLDISVNVLYLDEGRDIIPIRTSKFCNQRKYHVNLLMLTDQDKFHYTSIQSLSRLIGNRTKHRHRTFICDYCLHPFSKERHLKEHLPICSRHEPQQIIYPKPGKNVLKFDKFHFQFEVPFAIYADFESFLQKNDDQSDTHVPSGFCAVTTSIFQDYDYQLFCYTGENVMDEFFAHMKREEQRIRSILSANEPMKHLTPEEQLKHNDATVCISCNRKFTDKNRKKTRHHCHVTGKYIAPVCQICNLQLKYRKSSEHFFVPCFFHNNSAYDSHIIIKHLHDKNAKITVIPNNSEKFIGFQIDGIRFLDSFKFLPSSLDNLVQNMHNDGIELFKYTRLTFDDSDSDIFQKGIYPYEHMTDRDVFKETSLPPKEAFYSKLKMEGITDEEYTRAQQMWKRHGCKTMEDYTSLYVKLDTVLLADVFEQFRRLAFQQYGLDPAHCWTLAGYTWQAALKFTGMQLELITDPNIFLMVESAIRGGISTVTHRLATANNKYLKSYDPSKPTSFIMSWDVINLYGYCMLSKLPCGNFRFLEDPENFDFHSMKCDDDIGYILEVDLQYPASIHDTHSDLPLAPEHLKITPDMLSEYSKTDSSFHGQVALTPNLYDKTKYVLYLRNLQLYTQLGMKVNKIHRVLAFDQKSYLAPYILFNTEKRQQARSDFEKDLYKLLSNAVYGKTIEQLRSRSHVKLISDPSVAKRYIRKPTCKSFQIINNDLTMVHLGKRKIQMNKPIFAGMVILDIAKSVVYDMHYNYILNKFGEKAKLLFTDTDSLTYSIETSDIYDDIRPDVLDHFDCSEYEESHILFSTVNRKKLGMWKDEFSKTGPIRQFVGIRAKMYSIRCQDQKWNKVKAKGIIKAYRQRKLRHKHFVRALCKKKTTKAKFWQIRSSVHNLKTVFVSKNSLNPCDCKRYILCNGVNTLSYGHYSLRGTN